MQTKPRTVDPGVTVQELVDHFLFQGEQRAYPVVQGEQFEGLVTLHELRAVERSRWPQISVKQVMIPSADLVTVAPDDEAARALDLISQHGFNQLPVVEQGRLIGFIHREDLMRWLSLFGRN